MPQKLNLGKDKGDLANITAPPVFLHSSWRTSSTWLWLRFRSIASTCSYYEIFNERLGSLNKDEAMTLGPESWTSRHPNSAPYFLEFIPLLELTGGVKEYHSSMAIGSFIPQDGLHGSLLDEEASYVSSLINHARTNCKQPVLTDTRTLGRLSALKRQFNGVHIFLHRNLLQQWASYTSIGFGGDLFYLNSIRSIVDACQHDPFIRSLSHQYPLDVPDYRSEAYFSVFLLLHLYLYTYAFQHADISIDMTRLAQDKDYKKHICKLVHQHTSLSLDLDGARSSFEMHLAIPDDVVAFRKRLLASVQEFNAILNPKKKPTRHMNRIIDDLFDDIDRHKFFAQRITSVVCQPGGLLSQQEKLSAQIDSLQSEHRIILDQRNELSAQRDILILERDRTQAELIAAQEQLADAQLDRERLTTNWEREVGQRKHSEAELAAEHATNAEIRQRLDALSITQTTLIEGREICQRILDSTSTDRDYLRDENKRLEAEFKALQTEYARLLTEGNTATGTTKLAERTALSRNKSSANSYRKYLNLLRWRELLRRLSRTPDSQRDRT